MNRKLVHFIKQQEKLHRFISLRCFTDDRTAAIK